MNPNALLLLQYPVQFQASQNLFKLAKHKNIS